MKKFLLLVGQSFIGVILFWLFIRSVDLHDFLRYSAKISVVWIVWAVLAYIGGALLRVWRFQLLMRPVKRMKFSDVVAFSFASALLNYLIPLRIGEVGRGWFMKRKYHVSLVSGTMVSLFDKLFDLLASLALALVLFPWLRRFSALRFSWFSVGAVGVVVFSLLILFVRGKYFWGWFRKFFSRFPVIIARLVIPFLDKVLEGLLVLKVKPIIFFVLLLLSIFGLVLDGLSVYLLYLSFGSFVSAFVVVLGYTVFNLSFLIPAGPGYVGNIEFLGVFVFSTLFGLPKAVTASVILVTHLLITFVLAVLGFISLAYLHFDVKKWRLGLLR